MKDKDKEKDKKGRYLSPSFRKGVVKDKKEDDDEGDFKINLIKADDDDDDEKDNSKSPSKKKKTKGKDDKDKKEHHRSSVVEIPEEMKVNALATGRVKNVAYLSQAGK